MGDDQNNFGYALQARRARERHSAAGGGGRGLSRGAEERTRERVPLVWAMTQNNLGSALRLGERESGTARPEEAVAAFSRSVDRRRTRERVPLHWAQTQENLAIAFRELATRAGGEARRAYLRMP